MVYSEVNITDIVQICDQELDDIVLGTKKIMERDLQDLFPNEDIDINNYHVSYEIICKIVIDGKK